MGKINLGRLILGGLVAGVVSDILGSIINGWLLSPRWMADVQALGEAPAPDFWIHLD